MTDYTNRRPVTEWNCYSRPPVLAVKAVSASRDIKAKVSANMPDDLYSYFRQYSELLSDLNLLVQIGKNKSPDFPYILALAAEKGGDVNALTRVALEVGNEIAFSKISSFPHIDYDEVITEKVSAWVTKYKTSGELGLASSSWVGGVATHTGASVPEALRYMSKHNVPVADNIISSLPEDLAWLVVNGRPRASSANDVKNLCCHQQKLYSRV